jgi:hypothetical protein
MRISVPAAAAGKVRAVKRRDAMQQKSSADWKRWESGKGWWDFMGISCSGGIATRLLYDSLKGV